MPLPAMTHSSAFLLPASTTPPPNDAATTYALVVLNQRLPRFAPLLWARARLRVCADGGANRVFDGMPELLPGEDPADIRARYKPDVIKGDMDSIRPEVKEYYSNLEAHGLHLHSYSGATRSWSANSATCLHSDQFRMAGAAAAVVHRGAAHWLYFDARRPQDDRYDLYALRAEVSTARVSMTKLPAAIAGWSPFLCVSGDGRLSIASVHATRVEVWTQQHGDDDGDPAAAWLRTRSIQIPPAQPAAVCSSMLHNRYWFHLNKGAMLAVYNGDGAGAVLVVDIEKKVVEKVMDCSPRFGYYSFVPYEMDLPEFFLLQLAGRN